MATIFYSASYRISGPETAAEGADTVEFHISTPSIRVTDEDVAAIDLADASETRDHIIGWSLWCATPSHVIEALAMQASPPTADVFEDVAEETTADGYWFDWAYVASHCDDAYPALSVEQSVGPPSTRSVLDMLNGIAGPRIDPNTIWGGRRDELNHCYAEPDDDDYDDINRDDYDDDDVVDAAIINDTRYICRGQEWVACRM